MRKLVIRIAQIAVIMMFISVRDNKVHVIFTVIIIFVVKAFKILSELSLEWM